MVGAARSRWLKEIPIPKLIGRKAERGDFLIQWDAGYEARTTGHTSTPARY